MSSNKRYLGIIVILDTTNNIHHKDIQWFADPRVFQMNMEVWDKILKLDSDILCIRVQHDRILRKGMFLYDNQRQILKVSHFETPSYGHTNYAMNVTLNAFDIIRKHFDYDFIIRSSTSSFWVLSRLKELLQTLQKTNVFKGSKQFFNGVTGSGFILSKDVVDVFLKHEHILRNSNLADDVTFSALARQIGIPLQDMEICNIEFPNTPNVDQMIKNTTACHFRVKSSENRLENDTIIFNNIYEYFYNELKPITLVGWHHDIDYNAIKSKEDIEIYHSNIINNNSKKKIYVQLEPNVICNMSEHIHKYHYLYDYILLFDTRNFKYKNVIPLIYGTTWIDKSDYGNIDTTIKEYKISTLCGTKNWTIGHKLRIDLYMNQLMLSNYPIELFRTALDGHGTINKQTLPDINNNKTIRSERSAKNDLFKTFQFSIVIENCREYGYFSEKIVDCLITKTIPIYYGCENISDYFNTEGWIILETDDIVTELNEKLKILNDSYYDNYKPAIEENYNKAITYSSCIENIYTSISKIPYIHINKLIQTPYAGQYA